MECSLASYGDTSEVGSITSQLATVLSKIEIAERGIENERSVLEARQRDKERIISLVDKQAVGGDLLTASRRLERCAAILDIFTKGKVKYREKLQGFDIFFLMSSKPYFKYIRAMKSAHRSIATFCSRVMKSLFDALSASQTWM